MIAIKNGRHLRIANLGDSGFLLLRFSKDPKPNPDFESQLYCARRSKEQQHSFNVPYQLCYLPSQKHVEELHQKGKVQEFKKCLSILKRKKSICQDDPSLADEYQLELKEGDIIISGTDGLFDNLFTHEILTIIG